MQRAGSASQPGDATDRDGFAVAWLFACRIFAGRGRDDYFVELPTRLLARVATS